MEEYQLFDWISGFDPEVPRICECCGQGQALTFESFPLSSAWLVNRLARKSRYEAVHRNEFQVAEFPKLDRHGNLVTGKIEAKTTPARRRELILQVNEDGAWRLLPGGWDFLHSGHSVPRWLALVGDGVVGSSKELVTFDGLLEEADEAQARARARRAKDGKPFTTRYHYREFLLNDMWENDDE